MRADIYMFLIISAAQTDMDFRFNKNEKAKKQIGKQKAAKKKHQDTSDEVSD